MNKKNDNLQMGKMCSTECTIISSQEHTAEK